MKRKRESFCQFRERYQIQKKVRTLLSMIQTSVNTLFQSDAVLCAIRASTKPTQSRLLSLPAELRNSIYELALIEPHYIQIDSNLKEPGVLHVNRQIHKEARSVWYTSNTFEVAIRQCDDSLLRKFTMHCNTLPVMATVRIQLFNSNSWSNLIRWCRNVWNGESAGMSPKIYGASNTMAVVYAAHKIVDDYMRKSRSWDECLATLTTLKEMSEQLDPSWKI